MHGQIQLIDGIGEFSPGRDKWVGKPPEQQPKKLTVQFKQGQKGFLDLRDPLSAHWANMLDEQAQANRPVFVEIDNETGVITNLLIPRFVTVERLDTDEQGNLRVRLHQSMAVHAVLKTDPNFAGMRDSLQAALADGTQRMITSTLDDLEIIDVREPGAGPVGPGETPPPDPDPPVTPERATDIFNDMNGQTCAPCNPSSDCIPFLYPDDGCWIRAHLMAYDMRAYSPPEDPEKIYIQGDLDPFVPNHPDCRLPWGWGWHIAPTLMVTLPSGDERRVIDPSLAATPISESDWVNLNNSSIPPTVTILPWTHYNPKIPGDTATEAQANTDMQWYRNALKTRCLSFGPPPYSCIKDLFFIMDRSTFSDDEVEAMLLSSNPAHIDDAFYVVLDGYSPDELGFTTATMQHQPTLTVTPPVSGMTVTADRLVFEYPTFLNRRQRLTWVYDIDFTDPSGFTAAKRTITLGAPLDVEAAKGSIYLIKQENPYELDGSGGWLSTDLRVFQIKTGESRFGVVMASNPSAFITQVIANLNSGSAGGQTFEGISTDQQTSKLELSQTVGGVAVYNFALAKVRYRSAYTDAQDVRVFFRLFPWQTTSVEYDQATNYRRDKTGQKVVPLLGKKNNDVTSIPCFASPRIDSAAASMTTQTDAPNLQTIAKDTGGAEVSQYFGCWLDINQTQPQFPLQFPAANLDGPYTSNRKSIQEHVRNEHQCLVSEIAFLPSPAENGSTPSTSDKLAQRNLAIVESPNPGLIFSRRIPQTFEIQPSSSQTEHDELMIDWGNIPEGSLATLYLPGIDSREMITLASQHYRHHRMRRIDADTIRLEPGGITYLPIPFTAKSIPGLLTVDLPAGIKHGQVFAVMVRQVTGERQPVVLSHRVEEGERRWRKITGSFQLTIPVRDKAEILAHQQRLLSNLRWIERAVPAADRWAPVFRRYVAQVAGRVDAMGGDSSRVAPSPDGQWQEAYRICRTFNLIAGLLILALLLCLGLLSGPVLYAAVVVIIAVQTWVVRTWTVKCRPTWCFRFRTLLVGSSLAAIMLAILGLIGISTPNLIRILLFSVVISVIIALVSWFRGCAK